MAEREQQVCPMCEGKGSLRAENEDTPQDPSSFKVPCWTCGGTGRKKELRTY